MIGLAVVNEPIVCWPWHLWSIWDEPVQGADCGGCGRPVAIPTRLARRQALCVYCGLDRGLIPAEDRMLEWGAP